jgi:RecA-family ATPase
MGHVGFDPSSVTPITGNLAVAWRMARAGLSVFPCDWRPKPDNQNSPTKRPLVKWASEATDDLEQILRWWARWPDALVGLPVGVHGLIVVDADRHGGPDGVAAFQSYISKHAMPDGVPIVETLSGGRHYYFAQPAGKALGNSKGALPAGIDVRGAGGFVIAPGTVWRDASYRDAGPQTVADAFEAGTVQVAPAWLVKLLEPAPEPPRSLPPRSPSPSSDRREEAYARAALDAECAEVASTGEGGRNTALNKAAFSAGTMIGAGWIGRGECESALIAAAAACGLKGWEARATIRSGINAGEKKPREPLDEAALATFYDPQPRRVIIENGVAADAETGEIIEVAEPAQPAKAQTLAATPFEWPDCASIPQRQWLYGRHLIRGFVSATISPGGVGKSSLTIAEALAMISGRPLLHGVAPTQPLNVWLWNGEDPIDELNRRVTAAAKHYGLTRDNCRGALFLDSGRTTRIVIAEMVRNSFMIIKPVVDEIKKIVADNRIDVIVIDPFVSSHRVSENDNNAIDAVVKEWATVADVTGCAIELVHHSRKTGGGEVTVEDARGASALISAARSARALNPMTDEEARSAGVESARAHFRVGNGKSSMAPADDAFSWFKIESVELGNGPDGGDNVGVVTEWRMPSAHKDVLTEHLRAVQEKLREGVWRESKKAKKWAGEAIAEILEFDMRDQSARETVEKLLYSWIKDGYLQVIESVDENRMKRKFIVPGRDIDFHNPE